MRIGNISYRYINILSLDVVAGAVIGALFFGRLFGITLPAAAVFSLAITVWIVYTGDHLLDARHIQSVASTDRHRFHHRNFPQLIRALAGASGLELLLFWFLPLSVLHAGLVLGLAVALYVISQRYLRFLKEPIVAILYTAGIMLPSLVFIGSELSAVQYVVMTKYCITALMNLLLFSLFDDQTDRHQRQHSFTTWFGRTPTRVAIIFLGLLNIASGLWLWDRDARAALVFVAMNLSLLSIMFLSGRFMKNNYYRILGDAVFFIPLIYLL